MPLDQYWTLIDDELVLLEPARFENEDELQSLVARYPELVARSIDENPDSPGWLLVEREAGITFDEGDARTRWSLDHLCVDADGVPTLIEVKRASDPRIRREVIAQLLDYAASFRADWSGSRLRDSWIATTERAGSDPTQQLSSFLESTDFATSHEFWAAVDTNIAANNLRLLIVADEIPGQLRRIIEYLNEQMEHTEVLGVEIRPRRGVDAASRRSYSVSVIGATEQASITKGRPPRQTVEDFRAVMLAHRGADELDAVNDLVEELEKDGGTVSVGTRATNPQLFANFTTGDGNTFWPIAIRPKQGRLYLQLKWLAFRPGFEREEERAEFRDRIARATGTDMSTGKLNGFPWFPTSLLTDAETRGRVLDEVRWAVDTVCSAES